MAKLFWFLMLWVDCAAAQTVQGNGSQLHHR
jgi:hypothetical protein